MTPSTPIYRETDVSTPSQPKAQAVLVSELAAADIDRSALMEREEELSADVNQLRLENERLRGAVKEQADFLASLHTTYRHDGRLAARIEAHLSALRAALTRGAP
jgi:hypothetical protein